MKVRTRKIVLTRMILANQKAKTIRNPLRTDPTRTGGMREHFCRFVDRQFDKLKADVLRAVGTEDWLGVGEPVENVFNPEEMRDAKGHWSVGISVRKDDDEVFRANFSSHGKQFRFYGWRHTDGSWSVGFDRLLEEGGDTTTSGGGNPEQAIAVMTKAFGLLMQIMRTKNPTFVEFETRRDEESRIRLYDTLAKRISDSTGWKLEREKDEHGVNWKLHNPQPTANLYRPVVCNGGVGYFPSYGLIEVPDVRQDEATSCGAAAAMSVGKHFGVGPDGLAQWKAALGTSYEGTHPQPIVEYLRELGLQVEAFQHGNLSTLDGYLAKGWPVLCCVQDYGPKRSWEHGHYLVVIGHKEGYVFAQDPAMDNVMVDGHSKPISELGSLHVPGRVMVPEEDFVTAWHDEDEHGKPYVRFGIAVGPAVTANCNPSQMRGADGRCGPGIGLDIPRKDMPQIRKDDMEDFLKFCESEGVDVLSDTAPASDLKPTQGEFRQERVDALPDEALKYTVLVSKDNYILDGTHRWIKHWQKDKQSRVPLLRIMLPVQEAIDLMRRFPKTQFVENANPYHDKKGMFTSARETLLIATLKSVAAKCGTPEEANAGHCYDIAQAVAKQLKHLGVEVGWGVASHQSHYGSLEHAYVTYGGKHYDAEDPQGVDHPSKLSFFKRHGGLVENSRWAFATSSGKLAAFGRWLKTRMSNLLTGRTMREAWSKYIEQGWRKGAARAFDDTRQRQKWERHPDTVGTDLYRGGREEFLRSSFNHPESVEKVQLLASRTFTDLDGVTSAMSTKMARTLADGLTMGRHPHEIASSLVTDVDKIGRRRAILIARTECLPSEALIDAAVVRAVFRRWYEGEMVEIATSNGSKLTATPNHPILTTRGWMAISALQPGDHLIRSTRTENLRSPGDPNVAAHPVPIGEIFSSLQTVGIIERKCGAKPDFHGDGRDSEIEILSTHRELRLGANPSLDKPTLESVLSPTLMVLRNSFCPACHSLLPVDQSVCFVCGSKANAHLCQSVLNSVPARLEYLREGSQRLSRRIQIRDLVGVDVGSELIGNPSQFPCRKLSLGSVPHFDSEVSDHFENPLGVVPCGLSDLLGGVSSDVEIDEVLLVSSRQFSGHVYNLETKQGYYTTQGYYTGNCIRAHAEGQLDNLERLGVAEVGVAVEWATANDDKVCPRCAALQGIVLKTREAHGLIPFHPECRCAFIPSFDPPSSPGEVEEAVQMGELDAEPKKGVFNSDQYRDIKGRFATARDASTAATEASRNTDSIRIPGVADKLDRIDRLSLQEGDSGVHNNLANMHHALAIAHEDSAGLTRPSTREREERLLASRLHRAAADEHWAARDHMRQVHIKHNPGFDLTDRAVRLAFADYLDEHGHSEAAEHLRLYSI